MTSYGKSNPRCHNDWCEECSTCLHIDNNNERQLPLSKRFVTVGSVRYGVRLGAVSPPPPGAGPRYRSHCCWSSTAGTVSRIPLLTASPINSRDIFSCVNRVRMAENATSELAEQVPVHTLLLNTPTSLFNRDRFNRRKGFVANSPIYDRLLCECDNGEPKEDIPSTLDRLPRFRFGGNRGSINRIREREKRENDVRLKDLTDRLKRTPVPPPRARYAFAKSSPEAVAGASNAEDRSPADASQQPAAPVNDLAVRPVPMPHRSSSFSKVDYSPMEQKYVIRQSAAANETGDDPAGAISTTATLPRTKNVVRGVASLAIPETSLDKDQQKDSPEETALSQNVANSFSTTTATATTNSHFDIIVRNPNEKHSTSSEDHKEDKSRRRKGMYIDQWPSDEYDQGDDLIPSYAMQESSQTGAPPDRKSKASKEIPKVQISCDKESDAWSSPQEPLSPEEEPSLEWLSGTPTKSSSACSDANRDNSLRISKVAQLLRADSLSEGEPDQDRNRSEMALVPSDVSDCESRTSVGNDTLSPHVPRRYSKRPLRGPYGQMLEAEMKKPESGRKNQYANDLKFLEDLSTGSGTCSIVSLSSTSSMGTGDPKPKYVNRSRGSSNHSLDDAQLKNNLLLSKPIAKRKVSVDSVASQELDNKLVVSHQRTTSSPSKLEGFHANTEASSELLEQLLRGSSEQLAAETNIQRLKDTRTHVVVELYDTECSYVESLQILVTKYLEPLKSPENSGLLDASLVDEMFFQIPTLLTHHQSFLDELKKRLEQWDSKQKVGDILLDMFSNSVLIDSYTNYVNNSKRAREIYKTAQQSKPAFARFLAAMAREHKGKLALDSLLIKPIQKFPKYELLLQRLIKHTDPVHPDHSCLLGAQRELHEQLLKINCTEREALELDQLREIEGLVEGLFELVTTDRQYLRHDSVHMTGSGGTRKERALFLFSDLLLITSIKRRSGTMKKPASGQGGITSFDANKYKLLMKIALDDLEIVRAKDENFRQMMLEIENLTEDISTLTQIQELVWTLHGTHSALDEIVKEMLANMNKQLIEQQNSDAQFSCLDLTITNSTELLSLVFSKPDKRASWEEAFNEAKHKLAMSGDRRPCPKLVATVPIRKTRAGLQFSCAAPRIGDNGRDVWICNSDGYVGQVCILSLQPEPTVTSCNGVCSARILCIASVPGINSSQESERESIGRNQEAPAAIQFDSCSSSEEDERSDNEEPDNMSNRGSSMMKSAETISTDSDEADTFQSTMWLGTEDGCIHVYNSSDNIRIKKNKVRLQHCASILSIIYLDNKVFISLANGDIVIYERDMNNGWNTSNSTTVTLGTTSMPVSKMSPHEGKLWCACGNTIKVLNIVTLNVDCTFTVNNEPYKTITSFVMSGNSVWLSLQNSAIIKCYHVNSFELLHEVNVASAVTKMLTSCDDIIRQHKAACLRVTALLACKDLLWIGTSAGVLLTMPLPPIVQNTSKLSSIPTVMGIPHGHTGHVRFLTHVECHGQGAQETTRHSYKGKSDQRNVAKQLIISGGDGYEDFRSSNLSEVAGREDSTNHLLLWNI